jgi:putative ABC transport system substrate-binding protein
MKKIIAVFALALAVLVFAPQAHAQKGEKIPRIGMNTTSRVIDFTDKAFLQGLRDLGYVEGKNILIVRRSGKGKINRSKMMVEFVRLKVDVIVVNGGASIRAALKATRTIPIVTAYGPNLASRRWRLIASVAKPGGNITGSYNDTQIISGKRAELLRDIVPKASPIAILGHPIYPKFKYEATVKAARRMGMKVQSVYVSAPKEFQSAFAAMIGKKAGGVVIIRGPFTNKNAKRLLELAIKNRLPTMCEDPGWVKNGCLLSYGPSNTSMHRRAAYFVDKILKGANPGDLPMERPKEFELGINLKTAKKIGITFPPEILLRATKVIK